MKHQDAIHTQPSAQMSSVQVHEFSQVPAPMSPVPHQETIGFIAECPGPEAASPAHSREAG